MVDVVSFSPIAGTYFGCSCNPDGQHGGVFLCLKPLFAYAHLIPSMPFQVLEKEDALCRSQLRLCHRWQKRPPLVRFLPTQGQGTVPTLLPFGLLSSH